MVSIALRDQLIKSIIIYFGEPCRESLSIDETRVSKQGKIRARTGSEKCDRLRWEPKKKAQPEPIGPTFSFMYFARSLWSLRSSNELGNTNTKFLWVAPLWRKQHWFLRAVSAAHHSPMAHSPETGPSLCSEQNDVASQAQAVGSAPLASRWELKDLPESIQNTITQGRAPVYETPLCP